VGILLIPHSGQRLERAARDGLESQADHMRLKREDRELEQLAMPWHKGRRGTERGGCGRDPAVETSADDSLRAVEGRMLGDARE